jgi:hypothetical protein
MKFAAFVGSPRRGACGVCRESAFRSERTHGSHPRRRMKFKKTPAEAGIFLNYGVPKGIRTPVAAVKGQCPRPLDDGDAGLFPITGRTWWS